VGKEIKITHALLHGGEEPPISGTPPGGSGTIFFTRCNLSCVFCQNHKISQEAGAGEAIGRDRLVEIMFGLEDMGAYNINLVSPTPYAPELARAISSAKGKGLRVPVVYNTGGYDSLETLAIMDGLVDIYLPDAKIAPPKDAPEGDPDGRSMRLLDVGDYPWVNRAALLEMFRQVGHLTVDGEGLAVRGMLIRHLVLPDNLARTRELLPWLRDNFGEDLVFTLMSQYYPTNRVRVGHNPEFRDFPGLGRPLSVKEYDVYVDDCLRLNLRNTIIQDPESSNHYRPDFSKRDAFD
jgi:putative pyruvate formate lyase activating enzyme